MKNMFVVGIAVLIAAPAMATVVSGNAGCHESCEDYVLYLDGGSSASGEGTSAVFDQRDKVFIPHVLPVLKGTTVEIKNGDPFLHNVHVYEGKETVLNLALPFQGMVMPHTFSEPGRYAVLCDAHSEMSAFIVVLETPYFASPDDTGAFSISDVPPGEYTLVRYNAETDEEVRKSVEVAAAAVDVSF